MARDATRPIDVLTLGEAMVLFVATEPGALSEVTCFRRATAGAEFNVAIGLARLGLRVSFLTRVGGDAFGRHVQQVLQREGIAADLVQQDAAHRTGFMLKALAPTGQDPAIEYHRRGSAASHLGLPDLPATLLPQTRHVHLTGIAAGVSPSLRELVFELARQARAQGCTLSFDPNLRPALWPSPREMIDTLMPLAALCDWILPGQAEGERLTGRTRPEAIADAFLAQGARGVVVKQGGEGAWFHDARTGQRGHLPAQSVAHVVDTVGAGDGFAVGVISALLEGLDLGAATARGHAIGARVLQFPGDCDGLPTRDELSAFLSSSRQPQGACP